MSAPTENDVNKVDIVVYAGAAPGGHISLLADLFPHVRFELFDERAFAPELTHRKNVRLHNSFLTESYVSSADFLRDICGSPSIDTDSCTRTGVPPNTRLWLFSDIRSVDPGDRSLSMQAVDAGVLQDMRLQE